MKLRQQFNAHEIEDALLDLTNVQTVEKQLAGMQNQKTQWRLETDDPETVIEKAGEIAAEFGATFDASVTGTTVTMSPWEPADGVVFEADITLTITGRLDDLEQYRRDLLETANGETDVTASIKQ